MHGENDLFISEVVIAPGLGTTGSLALGIYIKAALERLATPPTGHEFLIRIPNRLPQLESLAAILGVKRDDSLVVKYSEEYPARRTPMPATTITPAWEAVMD